IGTAIREDDGPGGPNHEEQPSDDKKPARGRNRQRSNRPSTHPASSNHRPLLVPRLLTRREIPLTFSHSLIDRWRCGTGAALRSGRSKDSNLPMWASLSRTVWVLHGKRAAKSPSRPVPYSISILVIRGLLGTPTRTGGEFEPFRRGHFPGEHRRVAAGKERAAAGRGDRRAGDQFLLDGHRGERFSFHAEEFARFRFFSGRRDFERGFRERAGAGEGHRREKVTSRQRGGD